VSNDGNDQKMCFVWPNFQNQAGNIQKRLKTYLIENYIFLHTQISKYQSD